MAGHLVPRHDAMNDLADHDALP
ncbi:MAG: hypothetical protein QOH17_928, partial [Pseudonocardiales bacterium]|nr:hypothetical protein [Pseudonocardiales bacterium]